MIRRSAIAALLLAWLPMTGKATSSTNECVVLLHGFGRTPRSMKSIERALEAKGYHVVSVGYPTWRTPVEQTATNLLPAALARAIPPGVARIHFVTYSLGGILLRQYLQTHALPNLGRVVMLGVPNRGSELADTPLKQLSFIRWLVGPNLSRLGTSPDDLPRQLGPMPCETGIIAGNRRLFGWPSFKSQPNDGRVTVASATVEGMTAQVVVRTSHFFLLLNKQVREQVTTFIAQGKFADE